MNPFALIPQPMPEDVKDPHAIYYWLYKIWLKLRGTDTTLAEVASGISQPSRTVTGNTTETLSDHSIVCNSATPMTVALLLATGSNRVREIKNLSSARVTVKCAGLDTIDNEATQAVDKDDCLVIKDYSIGLWMVI
jgi:hypothetical protein